jgi:NAD+ dependent glucose-6-phosphate dehydrogenase
MRAESVLVTGARGNLGRKIVNHLVAKGGRRITEMDRALTSAGDGLNADLARLDPLWTRHFQGVDAVVHLAGEVNANAAWGDLVADNVDATINVLEAARASGIHRVILASSLHAAMGYEGTTETISPSLPANPISHYGASKAMGEQLGRHFALQHDLSVICLRIGWVPPGDNLPPQRRGSIALQHRWLSDEDLCQAFALAIDAEPVDFAIVNITSRVLGSPWTLDEAKWLLGYEPSSFHVPVQPRLGQRAARRLRSLLRPPRR